MKPINHHVKAARFSVLLILLVVFSCSREHSEESSQSAMPPTEVPSEDAQLTALADQLNMTAHSASAAVSRILTQQAQQVQGRLRGSEHQLKTKSSTLRKLKKLHAEHPEVPLRDLKISDALRYTMEIDDQPLGHYVEGIRAILESLEEAGHTVKQVKKYWPKGDNYSGVNATLMTTKGLEWELQFHTPASYAEAKRSHVQYERLRELKTPLAERKQLFNEMAKPWEEIPVPQGVLEPHNLHALEEIKQWSEPAQ